MKLIGHLEGNCVASIARLAGFSSRTDFSRVTFNDGLKYSILHDPLVEVLVESSTSFSISERIDGDLILDGPSISEGRLVDFVLGAKRVKAQHDNLVASSKANVNTGWLIVTAYYSAFFAAIEIARLHGYFPMSLASEDTSALKMKLRGKKTLVAQFADSIPRNYVGEVSGNKIIFRSSGDKPHVAAWDQIRKHVLKDVVDSLGWVEAVILMWFLSGDRSWQNPSDLRNEWNYKRADLFARSSRGIQFRKLIGNADGSQKWLAQAKHADDENKISILAALAETLCTPVTQSLERVHSSGIFERTF